MRLVRLLSRKTARIPPHRRRCCASIDNAISRSKRGLTFVQVIPRRSRSVLPPHDSVVSFPDRSSVYKYSKFPAEVLRFWLFHTTFSSLRHGT